MKRHQAFKFELRPNGAQVRLLRQFAGTCRFVYNKALALQNERFERGEKRLTFGQMGLMLTQWRADKTIPWLKAGGTAQTQQQALKNLEAAFVNFFLKRADCPRFKKKGDGDSVRFPQHFKIDHQNGRVWLVKLGWMRYRNSQSIVGTVKSVTVSLRAGKWFASILAEREVEIPLPESRSAVGIDLGVTTFAALSTGQTIAPLNSYKKHQDALAKAQRRMDRKVLNSRNWRKEKARVSKLNARIANVRRDFLNKASTAISKKHAMVCVEDLKVKNMTRSASGTVDAPGKSIRQKSSLNRVILDQGWCTFRRMLEYKVFWNGGIFIAVPPKYTSQTCPACGHVAAINRSKQQFACVECSYHNHADVVGAMNVLRAGHAQLACRVNGAAIPSATGTHRSDLAISWPGAVEVAESRWMSRGRYSS
ncbi:RNA-guided endonuclease InsQ/TnpB family protein [Caballeronia concitans]|uniref:Transposase n=1 Tax=Caballeronia concitans TaxID=1777133 RepID=A0A658R4Z2_9BURK|nr:RNA-guided endonuclease TnpB family protein [Caballeronia concitans]SAL51400.1 transposase [Caballeronia concitans]